MKFPEEAVSKWLDEHAPSWPSEPPQFMKDFVKEHKISEKGINFFLNGVWNEQEESYKQGFEDCLKLFTAAYYDRNINHERRYKSMTEILNVLYDKVEENMSKEASSVADFHDKFASEGETEELFSLAIHDTQKSAFREGMKVAFQLFSELHLEQN